MKEYEDTIHRQDYKEWQEEKARRRIAVMEYEKKTLKELSKAEQEDQLSQMNQHGFSFEDIIEMELDRQEKDWKKSLREIQPYQQQEDEGNEDSDNNSDNNDDEDDRQPRSYNRC